MFTADQLIAHAVGDYLLQSDWMATEKVRRSVAALAHVLTYVLPLLLLTTSFWAILAIVVSHFVIDRWRLARYLVWAKNWLAPRWVRGDSTGDVDVAPGLATQADIGSWLTTGSDTAFTERMMIESVSADGSHLEVSGWKRANPPWKDCTATGYDPDRPAWLTVWLMITADNILHVLCNGAAIHWLG